MCLQEEVRTGDAQGGYSRSWKTIAEVWAQIDAADGREKLFASRLESAVTHRVVIRFREGVSAGQRLEYEGKIFNIRHVSGTGLDRELIEMLVEEGVAS